MGGAAVVTVMLTSGSVEYLSVLYIITVFLTFVLSQLGMVRYWWANRNKLGSWKRKFSVNAVSLVLCSFILVAVTFLKFGDGGWIALIAVGAMAALALAVKRHYSNTAKTLKRMDNLVQAAQASQTSGSVTRLIKKPGEAASEEPEVKFDPTGRSAVKLVSGFNGLGLHTLFAIIRLVGGIYKNFIFV
jgi:K+ transporter